MSQASFDTHAAIRKLEKAGCPVPQAEAFVSVVMQAADPRLQLTKEVQQLRFHVETKMVSKTDLADLRAEMQARFSGVDERFASIDGRFASIDERFASIDERFASIDERIADMAAAMASLAEQQKSTRELMVTKGEFFRALWVQGGVLAALILTLAASMVSFVAFTLNGS